MGLVGLDLKTAKEVLHNRNIQNYRVLYKDTKGKTGVIINEETDRLGILTVYIGVKSIIRNLPSNFQKNESLKNFLMIFQHFNSEFDMKLDNIHDVFNPMATDRKFLFWLSSWFSLELGTDLPELSYRQLIKEIVPLYRWRGTKYGLQRLLEIISGFKPEIIEGYVEAGLEITDSIDFYFTESDDAYSDIGICFPVSQKSLGRSIVKTIFSIVEKEKPAHINCKITFVPNFSETRNSIFSIGEITLGDDSRL